MSNLDRRIERLEDKVGIKPELRLLVKTNVAPRSADETPHCVKIGHDRWAYALRGGQLTDDENRGLKQKHEWCNG